MCDAVCEGKVKVVEVFSTPVAMPIDADLEMSASWLMHKDLQQGTYGRFERAAKARFLDASCLTAAKGGGGGGGGGAMFGADLVLGPMLLNLIAMSVAFAMKKGGYGITALHGAGGETLVSSEDRGRGSGCGERSAQRLTTLGARSIVARRG